MTRHFVLDGNALTPVTCTKPNVENLLQEARVATGIYGVGLAFVDHNTATVGLKVGDKVAWPRLTKFVEELGRRFDPKEERGPLRISTTP